MIRSDHPPAIFLQAWRNGDTVSLRVRLLKLSYPAVVLAILLSLSVSTAGQRTTDAPEEDPTSQIANSAISPTGGRVDLANLCMTIATVAAQVGSIVVVFIAFATQELRRIHSEITSEPQSYRTLRDKSRLDMLLLIATIATSFLMVGSVFVLFMMRSTILSLESIASVGIWVFAYSIFVIIFALVAYIILERPFLRVLK